MARLNIEDSLFKDIRFFDLASKLGGMDIALGCLVRAWILAQKWFMTPDRKIPISEWEKHRIRDEIIEVNLAEIVGGKVRVRGDKENFGWMIQCSNAGKASAALRLGNHSGIGSTAVQRPLKVRQPLTLTLTQNTNTHTSKQELGLCDPDGSPVQFGLNNSCTAPGVGAPPLGADPTSHAGGLVEHGPPRPPNCATPPRVKFGPAEFVAAWNAAVKKPIGKVLRLTEKRERLLAARIRDIKKITDDPSTYLFSVIDKLNRSDFCRARTGGTWVANFDWFLRPDTMTQIEEGKFGTRRQT